MKNIITTIICLLTLTTIKAQEYTINSEKSVVEFNYIGEDAVGTINGIKGVINFNPSDLSNSYFEGRANIASINTGNKTRDAHLNASDYFHTKKYPEIVFKSETISFSDDKYILTGKMTIKDISKEEKIDFKFEDGMFIGQCVIYSNDYGIHKRKKSEDSKILIKIKVPIL
jgi:polyisoprenoid-binding protein YceI